MKRKIVGVNSAGKSAFLGPIVSTGVVVPEDQTERLEALLMKGRMDLSSDQRQKLADRIQDKYETQCVRVSAKLIKELPRGKKEVLKRSTLQIVQENEGDRYVVNEPCPDRNCGKDLQERIEEYRRDNCLSFSYRVDKGVAKHSAPAMAAGIVAESEREQEVEEINDETSLNGLRMDVGSGYPNDQQTREFVREYGNYRQVSEYVREGAPVTN